MGRKGKKTCISGNVVILLNNLNLKRRSFRWALWRGCSSWSWIFTYVQIKRRNNFGPVILFVCISTEKEEQTIEMGQRSVYRRATSVKWL